MDERYGYCPECNVELKVRRDGMLPYHSRGRAAVASKKIIGAKPEDYCPGGAHPPNGFVHSAGGNDGKA